MPQPCANCGGMIGDLEQPYLWGEYIVCGSCAHRLANQPAVAPPPPPPPPPNPDHVDLGLNYATPRPRRRPVQQRVQVIEQTSKAWKLQMILSSLVAIVGAVMLGVASNAGDREFGAVGVFALIAGVLWFAFARLGAWWNHG